MHCSALLEAHVHLLQLAVCALAVDTVVKDDGGKKDTQYDSDCENTRYKIREHPAKEEPEFARRFGLRFRGHRDVLYANPCRSGDG